MSTGLSQEFNQSRDRRPAFLLARAVNPSSSLYQTPGNQQSETRPFCEF